MGVKRQNFIPQRKGTSQHSRLSNKLLPEYFSVDERTLADFLAFTKEFAKEIDFHEPKMANNEDRKSWAPFFSKDITIILASVVSIDVDTIDRGFEYHVQSVNASFDAQEKLIAFERLFDYLIVESNKIPEWYKEVMELYGLPGSIEHEVEVEMWKVIDQKLRDALVTLNASILQAKEVGLLAHYGELPFPEYGLDNIPEEFTVIFRGENILSMIENAMVELRSVYHIIFNCFIYSKNHFQSLFERTLVEKGDHHPDVGLFITFLRLFQHAQKDLNGITLRHLEYYYRHILIQEQRPAISDSVHVCFELVRNASSCRIPQGAELFAGRDDYGREIRYSTVDEFEVNRASVSSLRSVFISRVLEGQTWTYRLVTGLYCAPIANSSNGKGAPFDVDRNDWPLFGEEQYKSGRVSMDYADVGFAISSPILMLAEGKRIVRITMEFSEDPKSEGTYRKLIEDLKESSDEEALHDALFEVFGRGKDFAFKLMLSTASGWIDVAEVASNTLFAESRPWDWNKLTIGFTIPASVPPIVPIDPNAMANDGYTPKFPVLKFLLNPQKTPFGYTFLETLRFENIDIEVEVDKVKDLVMFNELGRLDASQPFQALGPIPNIGSYVLIGNTEVFRKNLTSLKFQLDWQNMPSKGLREYYKEYFETDIEISEDQFKVNLTALSGYEFKPPEDEDKLEFNLFPTDPTTSYTYIDMPDPRRLQIRPDADIAPLDSFDNQSPIGFFRLELTEPKLAFGHSLFQERMTEVAMHNADLDETENKRYPNAPFSPVVKSLVLSYKATDRISMEKYDPISRNEIYHIHPFGVVPIFTRGQLQAKEAAVIPPYGHDGYLYIGLKDLSPPQEVSLLFQLAAGKITFTSELPEIDWCYLSGSDWEPLRTIDLLSDTTDNFTRTGIVRLRLPSSISSSNPVLPNGIHWLRVSIRGNTDAVSRALEIRAQAVKADWVQDGEMSLDRLKEPLKSNSINRMLSNIPQIRDVNQPYPSFNARPEEIQHDFFQRVAERLRHKNRAITHWDYERIVLNQFYTVSQVKCLSHTTHPKFLLPGSLRIVVIPGRSEATDVLTPKVTHGGLREIQDYMKEHASPFSNFRVSNPSYEYVRVNCRCKFANRKNNGESLEKLRLDIRDFICPWLNSPNGEIQIGGDIKVSDLFRFIQTRPYVDFITKFAVVHFYVEDEETGVYKLKSSADPRLNNDERSYIRAQKPWSVLIPDRDHEIEFTEREHQIAPEFNLEPVDFQGRFQISPHLIKILPKKELPGDNDNIRYDQEDSIRIFVDVPD